MVKNNVVTSQPTESFILVLNLFHQRIVTGFAGRDEREKADFSRKKRKKKIVTVYTDNFFCFFLPPPRKNSLFF
jgi:hypothetical protein